MENTTITTNSPEEASEPTLVAASTLVTGPMVLMHLATSKNIHSHYGEFVVGERYINADDQLKVRFTLYYPDGKTWK